MWLWGEAQRTQKPVLLSQSSPHKWNIPQIRREGQAPPLRFSRSSSGIRQGRPLGLPPRRTLEKGICEILDGRVTDPPLRRIQKPSVFNVGAGPRPARRCTRRAEVVAPYSQTLAAICSAKPGAGAEPHQLQFWEGQGPVARQEFRPITQILRAGNFAHPNRYASPVMGVLGGRRIWTRSVHPEPIPLRLLVPFPRGKGTRRRGGETPFARKAEAQLISSAEQQTPR